MANDRAADRLVDVHSLEAVLVDQAVQRRRQHRQVGLIGIKSIGTAEGNAYAPDHANPPQCLFHPRAPSEGPPAAVPNKKVRPPPCAATARRWISARWPGSAAGRPGTAQNRYR